MSDSNAIPLAQPEQFNDALVEVLRIAACHDGVMMCFAHLAAMLHER